MKKLFKILFIVFDVVLAIVGIMFVLNNLNASSMEEYIDTFERVQYDEGEQLFPEVDEHENYYFTTDGEFKILHLTDVHLGGGIFFSGSDKMAINAVAAMVSAEKPDLVVVTGDISFAVPWTGTLDNSYAHGFFKRLMERLGVYWTVTFGNHDSEAYNYHNREAVAKMYEDSMQEYCLFSSGPDDIYGECNHVINVKNSKGIVTESLIMIDSNAYTEDDVFGLGWDYDCIHDDQVAWYEGVIELYSAENKAIWEKLPENERPEDYGNTSSLKSLVFMHIPPTEVKDAYDEYVNNNRQNTANTEYFGGHDGEGGRIVCCSDMPDELFESILALGSTEGLFYGHDHLNNFVLRYKGVKLSYGYSIDYAAYAGIASLGFQRGCTVITVGDGEPEITHENYYQDKYESLYPKEAVNMEKIIAS